MRVEFLFDREPQIPFRGSPGFLNKAILDSVPKGWNSSWLCYQPETPIYNVGMPFSTIFQKYQERGHADLSIFTDQSIDKFELKTDRKNLVYLHGFMGFASNVFNNDQLHGFLCNSEYSQRVLEHFLSLPRIDDPSIPIQNFRKPCWLYLPKFDHFLGGYESCGKEEPKEVDEVLDDGQVVVGHCIQPAAKTDIYSVLHISRFLSQRLHELKKKLKVFVHRSDWEIVQREHPELLTLLEELTVPVEFLKNNAIHKIMRRADFTLLWNRGLDTFGMYALESIFERCPVYTNGQSNLRYLLPQGNGIVTLNKRQSPLNPLRIYKEVGNQIFEDILSQSAKRQTATGLNLCKTQYSKFQGTSLPEIYEELSAINVQQNTFKAAKIGFSCFVREVDIDQGVVVTDRGTFWLGVADKRLIVESIDKVYLDYLKLLDENSLKRLQYFIYSGVLTVNVASNVC